MRFTFIKQRHCDAGAKETEVRFLSVSEERATVHEHTIKAEEGATPEFVKAMRALTPHVVELLALPKDYAKDFEVHTLHLKHSDDRWSIVVSGSKKLAAFRSPFNISTPLLAQPATDDGYGKTGIIPRPLEEKVLAVIAEANRFREGERDQVVLDLKAAEKKTGRGTSDLTPIEEEVERQAKTFRSGEIPPENGNAAGPEPSGGTTTEDARPLTSVQALNPTILSILSDNGITTVEELRERYDEVPGFKSIGKRTMKLLDGAMEAELGANWWGKPEAVAGEEEGAEEAGEPAAEAMPV